MFRRHLGELLPAVADKYPSGRYPSCRKFWQMVLILEQISAGRLFQQPELPSLDRVLRFDELPVGLDQFVLDDGPFLSKLPGLGWPSPEHEVMVTIDSLPKEPERSGKLLRLLAAKWPPDKLHPESDLTAIQRLLVDREKQAAVK